MAYVDNLLDWADSLFAEFTTESVNEATLLYAMAAAVLGDRPPKFGDCGEGDGPARTFVAIEPLLDKGGPFLGALETVIIGRDGRHFFTDFIARWRKT